MSDVRGDAAVSFGGRDWHIIKGDNDDTSWSGGPKAIPLDSDWRELVILDPESSVDAKRLQRAIEYAMGPYGNADYSEECAEEIIARLRRYQRDRDEAGHPDD